MNTSTLATTTSFIDQNRSDGSLFGTLMHWMVVAACAIIMFTGNATVIAQPQFANVQVANFTPVEDLSIQLKTNFATLPPTFFQGTPPIAYTAIKGQIPANIAITMTLFQGPDFDNLTRIDSLKATLKANGNYILVVMGGANDVPITSKLIHNAQFETNNDNEVSFMLFNATTGTEPFRIDQLTNAPPYTIENEMVSNFGFGDTTEYGGLTNESTITFEYQEEGGTAMRTQFDMAPVQGKAMMFVLTGQKGGSGEQAIRLLGFTSDADPSAENRITGQIPTSNDDDIVDVPDTFILYGNYPNPFNPSTMLRFSLPSNGPVDVTVYDLLGRVRQVLKLGLLAPGEHRVSLDATQWPSGVYLYKVQFGGIQNVGKMTVIK